MWTDFLSQPQSVIHVFAGPPPALAGLTLREVRFRPSEAGEEVTLLLEWTTLPQGVPEKWHTKGYKVLQLTLSLTEAISITKHGTFGPFPVDTLLSQNRVVVHQPSTLASLEVECNQVFAKLHPYNGDNQHYGVRLG